MVFKKKRPEELPEFDLELPEFPSYEPSIKSPPKKVEAPNFEEPFELPKSEPISRPMQVRPAERVNKQFYIKIKNYEQSVAMIDDIKKRLQNVKKILDNLQKIKHEEDEELNLWQEDLRAIKDRIIEIDKTLFEG